MNKPRWCLSKVLDQASRVDLPYFVLGQHIRNHRLQLRQETSNRPWSQEDLAVAIGSDKAHINRIECGRQSPTLDTLSRICDALDLAWPARRRLLGLAGFLKDLPEPHQDDIDKIGQVVASALAGADYPVCLLDQDERIWEVNTAFAQVFLGYSGRSACLADISGRTFLELLCQSHPAHAYLRRTLSNFDELALRLLAILRNALHRQAAAVQYQSLLNDILADPHLCSLWLQVSAQINRGSALAYLDHQTLRVVASPIGPYEADVWHASLRADERFRLMHIVPKSDDVHRRFATLGRRRTGNGQQEFNQAANRESGVRGAEYPSGPIQIHVPWASGGVTDVGARILAPFLQQVLGQSVGIVNCDNAQSSDAIIQLARLPTDGHHLIFINEPVLTAAAGSVSAKLLNVARKPYLNQFDSLALHAFDPFGVYVRSESRYVTIRDIVRKAAAEPGKVIVGTSGWGTPAHIAALILEEAAGIRFSFRHYTGSLEHIARFLSGETDIACLGSGVSLPAVRAGEMRALVNMTSDRFHLMPETPTLAEAGLTGPALASVRRIVVPKNVNRTIRRQLIEVLNQAISSPEHIAQMNRVGLSTKIPNT
mgnify:CR=1 FL=1